MKTILEALKNREVDYSGWCDKELKKDAYMDLLKLLNVFTDIECPNEDEIKAMHDISEAIYHLCCNEDKCYCGCEKENDSDNDDTSSSEELTSLLSEDEKWKTVYPDVSKYLTNMVKLLCEFMECKAENKSCPEKIKDIFNCHKNLAQSIMTINNISSDEREVIHSFVNN